MCLDRAANKASSVFSHLLLKPNSGLFSSEQNDFTRIVDRRRGSLRQLQLTGLTKTGGARHAHAPRPRSRWRPGMPPKSERTAETTATALIKAQERWIGGTFDKAWAASLVLYARVFAAHAHPGIKTERDENRCVQHHFRNAFGMKMRSRKEGAGVVDGKDHRNSHPRMPSGLPVPRLTSRSLTPGVHRKAFKKCRASV